MDALLAFGPVVAAALKARLADLEAADTVADLIAGNPRVNKGTNGREMMVDLADTARLVFTANDPRVNHGDIVNWEVVIRIRILRIEIPNDNY